MQDGAAVTGLAIAAASLVAVNITGNPIYDPIGSIIVGNLLGMVCDVEIVLLANGRWAQILYLWSYYNPVQHCYATEVLCKEETFVKID